MTGPAMKRKPAVEPSYERGEGAGLTGLAGYERLREERDIDIKCAALEFLIGAPAGQRTVAGYGAAAKGKENTLLNFLRNRPEKS